MWRKIRDFLAPPAFEGDEEKRRAARLLNAALLTILFFSVVAPLLLTLLDPRRLTINLSFGAIGFVTATLLKWLLNQGWLRLPSWLLILMLFSMFTFGLYAFNGIRSTSNMGYVLVILMAGLLLGEREAIGFALGSALVTYVLFFLESNGFVVYEKRGGVFSDWLQLVISLGLVALTLRFAIRSIAEGFARARRSGQALRERNLDLERSRRALENRTRDLERRTRYLEATTGVARDAMSMQDPQKLVTRVVHLVSERLGFYHSGLFLVDATGEWAELQAASSQGGRRMLERGHRLRVGVEGLVGHVVRSGQPRIALDVGADAVYLDNPDLPETRSEVVLPLRAPGHKLGDTLERSDIIGALDVQSEEPEAFDDEDVSVLQALADQVAVAISNSQLFEQVQESLEAERRAYGELSRKAWQELIETEAGLGFFSDAQDTVPAGDLWRSEMWTALRTGEIASDDSDGNEQSGQAGGPARLAIPIKVRDQVIGVIDGCKPDGAGEWMEEELALLETLTEQLGVALESARLYRDTQRRAARERLTSEVTARMRESLDLETVINTAASEMRQALGLDELVIRLTEPKRGDGASQRGAVAGERT